MNEPITNTTTTSEAPVLAATDAANTTTIPEAPVLQNWKMPEQIRRGRHPEVTAGAFGNGRKHNGIKFRSSSLIRRFR